VRFDDEVNEIKLLWDDCFFWVWGES